MDINQYAIFLEVARQQNISKAAEVLGYTQSGISHTIRRMEKEMNLSLFYRNRNGAYLTSAGKELLPHIQQLIQCQENLTQTIAGLHNLHEGSLNIGTYSSISREWLPSIIREFKKDYPSVMIHFKEGGNKEILEWIINHEVDFGFLSADFEEEGIAQGNIPLSQLEWIKLKKDPLVAILPKDDTRASFSSFPIEEFNQQTFIISELGTDIDIHRTLQSHGIQPNIQYSSKDDYAIISMVACKLGISILPQLVVNQANPAIHTIPLDPPASRQLGIAIPSLDMASPAAKRFIEYTHEYLDKD